MGIKVGESEVVPQLEYNFVHLEELKIVQTRPVMEPPYAHFTLQVTYRLYALDDTGKRHYSNKPRIVRIEDYLAKAMAAMEKQDPRLIQAFGAIEQALATIIDESGKHGSASVI